MAGLGPHGAGPGDYLSGRILDETKSASTEDLDYNVFRKQLLFSLDTRMKETARQREREQHDGNENGGVPPTLP